MTINDDLDKFLKERYKERKDRTDEYCEGFVMCIKLIAGSYPEDFPKTWETIHE